MPYNNIITSIGGSKIGEFLDKPYWAVKLRSAGPHKPERWISEVDGRIDIGGAKVQAYDWTLDLITTGDILRIAQLWMFCPRNPTSPEGNTATFFFTSKEAGTAFMFHVTRMNAIGGRVNHMIIGKVVDRGSGDCVCFIWDDDMRVMSTAWRSNVNNFGTWRPGIPGKTGGIAPIGQLSHEVIGLNLRYRG